MTENENNNAKTRINPRDRYGPKKTKPTPAETVTAEVRPDQGKPWEKPPLAEGETPKKVRKGSERVILCKIRYKQGEKVYGTKSKYYGTTWYRLKLADVENLEPNKTPEHVYAYESVITGDCGNEQEYKRKMGIGEDILKDRYLGKRLLLRCWGTTKGYKLYDWEERPNQ